MFFSNRIGDSLLVMEIEISEIDDIEAVERSHKTITNRTGFYELN